MLCIRLILLCALIRSGVSLFRRLDEVQENDEIDASLINDDDKFEFPTTYRGFNYKYCTIKGCKVARKELFQEMRSKQSIKGFIKRNQILDPLYHRPTKMMNHSLLNRTVPYLGLLLDAGKQYFPIDWMRNLLHLMHALGYNLLHLRLTGDYAFNMRLTSIPDLANPALDGEGRVYNATELRELVSYADSLSIVIMPEISLPVNVGGWAGMHTPGLILPCARHICDGGGGLYLNMSHPKVHKIIRTVLVEVLDIFSTSPFLHLGGGDDLRQSEWCISEVQENGYTYLDNGAFETYLQELISLDLKNVTVLRWESLSNYTDNEQQQNIDDNSTDEVISFFAARGDISHAWDTKVDKKINDVGGTVRSQGLYLDATTDRASANLFYESTRDIVKSSSGLVSVIVEAFELSAIQWFDRNVVGRLIAVAMGASGSGHDNEKFNTMYLEICNRELGFDHRLCEAFGAPILPESLHHYDLIDMRFRYSKDLCNRLTRTSPSGRQKSSGFMDRQEMVKDAMANFWFRFADDIPRFSSAPPLISHRNETLVGVVFPRMQDDARVQFRGISLDLVRKSASISKSVASIISILDLMHQLNLDTMLLRLVSDVGFAIQIPNHNGLAWDLDAPFTEADIRRIVTHARSLGIQVIPEITTATRAGGWFMADILADCPKIMCQSAIGVGANVNDDFIAILVSVVLQLLEQFDHPPFIHLGFDEREEAKVCYKEAQIEVDLNEFERRLSAALKFQDIDESRIIRWENSEGIHYTERAGRITHFRLSKPLNAVEPFFISTGLHLENPHMADMDGWSVYREARKLVSYKPTGIFAAIDMTREWFLINFSIRQRLVAYATGLISPELAKEDFEKLMARALTALTVHENSDGKPPNFESALSEKTIILERRKEMSCDYRTVVTHNVIPKEGWLVEGDFDWAI